MRKVKGGGANLNPNRVYLSSLIERTPVERAEIRRKKSKEDPLVRLAIREVTRGATYREAAATVGKHERSVKRWWVHKQYQAMKEEERQEWELEIEEAQVRASRIFRSNAEAAAKVYRALLNEVDVPHAVKRHAAKDVLISQRIMSNVGDEEMPGTKIGEIRAQILTLFGAGAVEPRETLGLDAPPDAEGISGGHASGEDCGLREEVGEERGAGE